MRDRLLVKVRDWPAGTGLADVDVVNPDRRKRLLERFAEAMKAEVADDPTLVTVELRFEITGSRMVGGAS